MTTCENPATHQITGSGLPLCGECASNAKREGSLVEIRPAPELGGRRKPETVTCQRTEPEGAAAGPEPNEGDGP